MSNSNVSMPSLRMSSVICSCSRIIFRNIVLFTVLAIVVHFLSSKLTEEFLSAIGEYVNKLVYVNLSVQISHGLEQFVRYSIIFPDNRQVGDSVTFLRIFLERAAEIIAYYLLLQALVTQLIDRLISQSRSRATPDDILECYQNSRLLIILLRGLGLLIIFCVMFALILTLIGLISLGIMAIGEVYCIHSQIIEYAMLFVFVTGVCLYFFFLTRFSLTMPLIAMPLIAEANPGIISSMASSWLLSKSCWRSIMITHFIASIVAFASFLTVYQLVLWLSEEELRYSLHIPPISVRSMITITLIVTPVQAIVSSVCYSQIKRNVRST